MQRILLALLLVAAVAAWAGGGPTGFLVVYDPDDPDSRVVASHYQAVRGIPERNMVPYVFHGLDGTRALELIGHLREEIAKRGLAGQLQGIALAGYTPLGTRAKQGIPYGGSISLAGLLYNAPNVDLKVDPKAYPRSETNKAQRNPPATPTMALDGITHVNGATYWPVSHVGPTDRVALSPRAARAAIDAAKAADGTRPDGVVYWPLNGDVRSTTREPEINQVLPLWEQMGIKYSLLDGVWVAHRRDIAGGVVGIAGTDVAKDNTYLPGAWVDHLTSCGGFLWDNAQMPCTDFLVAGAAGSSGTMDEPYAIAAKFPHAHIYTHFRNGASLAEAFWQSIGTIHEILPVGDPLLQPYAVFPKVTLTAPATLKGTVAIKAAATGAGPGLELFVDGLRVTEGSPIKATRTPAGFSLDTTTLTDGWHELRAVAYAANAVRTQGEAVQAVTVANGGASLRLTGPAAVEYAAPATFTVAATGLPADAKVALRAGGRILADGPAGPLIVPAKALPFTGTVRLFAVATLADGREVWSAPLAVTVAWTPAPVPAPAVAQGVGRVRFFAKTTDKEFNWDTTAPTAQAVLTTAQCPNAYLEFRGNLPLPGIADDWKKIEYAGKPGLEYDGYFYADLADVYEFRFDAGTLLVDGQPLPAMKNGLRGPVSLAAGWHRVRLRFTVGNPDFQAFLYLRGGRVSKLLPLPSAWCATPAAPEAPAAPAVTIAKVAPVTGTTAALSAEAQGIVTWSAIRTPAIGAPIHPDLPAEVKFAPNGTVEAAQTTATFPMAGEYLLRCTAGDGARAATAETLVTVVPTPTKVLITAARKEAAAGYALDLYGGPVDQFGRRLPSTPALAWQSTPAGAFTPVTGETARFTPGPQAGAYAITASAGGVSGTCTLPVHAHKGATISPITVNPSPQGSVYFGAQAVDPDDRHRRFPLTYKWTVTQQPEGQAVVPERADSPSTQLKVAATGTYALQLAVTDVTGTVTTATASVSAVALVDGSIEFAPNPQCWGGSAYVDMPATISVNGYLGKTATFAWESSSDNGATWQKLPDTTQLITLKAATMADNGRLYRATVTNKVASVTAKPGKLTVSDPEGGRFIVDGDVVIAVDGKAIITVRRTRFTKGKVSLTWRTGTYMPGVPRERWAKEGEDYAPAEGTLTWEDGDAADKTITIPLKRVDAKLPACGFSVSLYNATNNSLLLRNSVPVWIPSADEPTPPTRTR
jgi:hypothetical protein